MPVYQVYWTQLPLVTVNAVSPDQNSPFEATETGDGSISNAVVQKNVVNWIGENGYSTVLQLQFNDSNDHFTAPTVTLQLSNAGNYTSATLSVPNGKKEGEAQIYDFSVGTETVTKTIGQAEWHDGIVFDYPQHQEAGDQKIYMISMIDSSGNKFDVSLGNMLRINQKTPIPELSFAGLDAYDTTVPETISTGSDGVVLNKDGNNSFTCTLPTKTWSQEDNIPGEAGTTTTTTSTETVSIKATVGYDRYKRTIVVQRTPTVTTVQKNNYSVNQWDIGGVTYNAGTTKVPISSKTVATATNITYITIESEETTKTQVITTVTDKYDSWGISKKGTVVTKVFTTPEVSTEYEGN